MNKGTLEAAKRATDKGIPVVRATRVPVGAVLIHGEVVDEDYGTVSSDELNPQKARIILMLALEKDKDMSREKLQELFINY
jgi:L-asparaginase